MTFEYIDLDQAMARSGLRMVVVSSVPSPWGEAAKGFWHLKGIEWSAVRLNPRDEMLTSWARQDSAPVAIFENEAPRHSWVDILHLAERLSPEPTLLPSDPEDRALALGLAHEFCGEGGLGWARRSQLVHAGLQGEGGFAAPVAKYLAAKYGHSRETGPEASARCAVLLRMFADRLKAQQALERQFYIGETLSAVDIYSATFMALFAPLPPEHCQIRASMRTTFETRDANIDAALDPILLAHRDRIYEQFLELPLSL